MKIDCIKRIYYLITAIAIMTLSTFWMSPFGNLKMLLGCFQLILTSIMIIGLAKFVPAHPEKVPYFGEKCFKSQTSESIKIIFFLQWFYIATHW